MLRKVLLAVLWVFMNMISTFGVQVCPLACCELFVISLGWIWDGRWAQEYGTGTLQRGKQRNDKCADSDGEIYCQFFFDTKLSCKFLILGLEKNGTLFKIFCLHWTVTLKRQIVEEICNKGHQLEFSSWQLYQL